MTVWYSEMVRGDSVRDNEESDGYLRVMVNGMMST